MNSFNSVIDDSLVLSWSCNWSDSSIDEAKTIVSGCTFGVDGICICLKGSRGKQCTIPLSYFVTMGVVNKVENFICDHGQHGGRPTKSWNHV